LKVGRASVGFGLRGVVALLLVASAAAFAGGREIERTEERRAEAAEIAEGGAEEETGREIAGINSDAPELTVVGVVLSLLLAAGVFLRPSRALLWLVALFGLGFTLLDVFWEAVHQIAESQPKIVAAAVVVAVLHVAVVAVAVAGLRMVGQPTRSSSR
jgi:hypothetical protein